MSMKKIKSSFSRILSGLLSVLLLISIFPILPAEASPISLQEPIEENGYVDIGSFV